MRKEGIYVNTTKFLERYLAQLGVENSSVDAINLNDFQNAIKSNTAVNFILFLAITYLIPYNYIISSN